MKEIDRRLEGDRSDHPPPRRPRGRGAGRGRARPRRAGTATSRRRRVRAACRPTGSPARASAATPTTTATIALTWATSEGWTDERRRKSFGGQEAATARATAPGAHGQGRPAASDVPPPQGLQVLLGQDRRHQLQGHEAAAARSCPSARRSCRAASRAPARCTSGSCGRR